MNRAPPPPYPSLIDRILANVREVPAPKWAGVDGPCWVWKRALNARGYGRISMYERGRGTVKRLVHRVVIQLWYGLEWHEIPVGAHLCSVKARCSPLHLDVQSDEQNRRYYYDFERPLREAVRERIPF